MQEIKSLVRFLFAFLMSPLKCLFRAVPLFGRGARALFRSCPKLKEMYERLLPPSERQRAADAALIAAQAAALKINISVPRKRPLTAQAAMIFSDLKITIDQKKSSADAARSDSASSSKRLS